MPSGESPLGSASDEAFRSRPLPSLVAVERDMGCESPGRTSSFGAISSVVDVVVIDAPRCSVTALVSTGGKSSFDDGGVLSWGMVTSMAGGAVCSG